MISLCKINTGVAGLLAIAITCSPAMALVTLNDGHDHIYVTGTFGVSRDSNIFANRDSAGDFVYNSGVSADYQRRAGWIGVNASVNVSAGRYGKLREEDFANPSYSLELTKQTGRTTGSFTLSGARESRADSAINLRSNSWNYNAGLNFKYPIIERFSLSGGFGYSARKYIEETQLANLSTYSANVDLFYVATNERDLVTGYRYRYGETSRKTSTTDHAFNVGVNGRIIKGINGGLRVGYQIRTPHGSVGDNPEYRAMTASASANYAINRKINISGSLSKDFSTTATDTSVEGTNATIDAGYAYSTHWNFNAGAAWGDSKFLGERGRIIISPGPPALLGPNRHDNFASWNVGAGYSLNDHFKASFTYSWFQNWSTIAFADFVRSSWSASFSSRW
jgi:hypothetical protein